MAPSLVLAPGGRGTVFSFYDLDRDELRETAVPLELGHTAVSLPTRAGSVLVPESAGERACILDVRTMKVERELRAAPGRLYGGHAAFSPDGKLVFLTEFEPAPSGRGFLVILDGDTYERVHACPSEGRYSHDVALGNDGREVFVSNLAVERGPHVKKSGVFVSRFSLPSFKFLGRTELTDDPAAVNADAAIPGSTSFTRSDRDVRSDAAYFLSYASLTRPANSLFAYPPSHRPIVDLWDVPSKHLVREFSFPEQPIALVYLRGRPLVAVAVESGRLYFIDVKKRELVQPVPGTKRIKVTTHLNQYAGEPFSY